MSKYIYPAVLTPDNGGFAVDFPDIDGCFTCGDSLEEALYMSQDALASMLTFYENECKEITPPSPINQIPLENGEFATLISCDTDEYRRMLDQTLVKRMVKIPKYLSSTAAAHSIDLSQTLQESLKLKLGIA